MKIKALHILLVIASIAVALISYDSGGAKNEPPVSNEQSDQNTPTLFLLSKGLTTDTLKQAFLNLLDKEPAHYSVAVVVNASSSEKKKKKKAKKIKAQFESMGFDTTNVKSIDLMKTSPKRLYEFDVIYILGGNPFLLLDEAMKSDALTVLKELAYQDKLLMGYSAGALLLGPDLSLFNDLDSLLGFNEIGLNELTCVGLYDFHIFPHYKDFTTQVPELVSEVERFESQRNSSIYRLNDNQGITIQNGELKIIG